MTGVELESAYRQCAEITRTEAKNFSYGIRLLRPPERQALSAVYALARRIDDIGDGDQPSDVKLAELEALRARVLPTPQAGGDPVLGAIADVADRYRIPLDAFGSLIDGCVSDVVGTSYETMDDLVGYCRMVASTIGQLSLAIFGCDDREAAAPYADALGVALQLTNILRDVVEDREHGRVYLPARDAEAVGCATDLTGPPDKVASLVALECEVARSWFDQGLRLLPLLERRSRACVAAMAGIYHHLLRRIQADPSLVLRGRLSLPTWEKAWVAAVSLSGGTP